MHRILFSCLALLAPLHAQSAKTVVAKVGDAEVYVDDLQGWLAGLEPAQREAAKKQPSLLTEAVRTLLVQRLVLQEAEAKKWADRPEVAAAIQRQRSTIVAESYLRSVAQPAADFPDEETLKKAYEAAGDALMIQRRHKLAQVFIAAPEAAKDKAAKDAEVAEVKKKLAAAGADFAAIARAHSEEAASAGKGGEIGWLDENLIEEGIRAEVTKVSKGGVTPPILLKDGWHFVKVLDREEPRKLTFDEVKPRLAERLREQQAQAASQAYVAKLLQDHPVVINEIELPKVLAEPKSK
ncbi:peptidylprolyl isomerase [Luteolibacter flavescens]|uniref:Peptidylprolyl isomerase n=1 Tax=Luteolibacter flavescens TaxID=1859460 RepID=A0ABT3FMZ5_9BACT|nr:peptidylprolyl isomerase [Luteolibacter flavescens]MCW1884951.1 peptidylprolyl isomerase [Luteolibacter flavescens]